MVLLKGELRWTIATWRSSAACQASSTLMMRWMWARSTACPELWALWPLACLLPKRFASPLPPPHLATLIALQVNPTGVDGLLYGGGLLQLWFQLVGVVIVGAWAALVTLPLVFLLRRFEWFSLQLSDEAIGLDGKDHELNAYRELEEFVVVERPTAVAVPSTAAAASTTSSRTTPLLHAVQEL